MSVELKDWWWDLRWVWQVSLLIGTFLALLVLPAVILLPSRTLPRLGADLAVTAFGAGLGVFMAFHLRELRSQRQHAQSRAEDQARLAELLDALRHEIERLTNEAEHLKEGIRGGEPIYEDPHLDHATWSAHRDRILSLEGRPSVRRDLVNFYEQVNGLRRLVHLYQQSWGVELQAGDIERAIAEVLEAQEESRHPGGEQARSLLVEQIRARSETVEDLGTELIEEWPHRIGLLQGPFGWTET